MIIQDESTMVGLSFEIWNQIKKDLIELYQIMKQQNMTPTMFN